MATNPVAPGSFKQQDNVPTRKVIAGGMAGAITAIAVYVLNNYYLPEAKPIPGDIGAAITTVLSFIISYFVPPAASDQVKSE